ncbi:MAG: 3-hydroxyacyl-CoA dehydrogenase family protein [Thermodesulfobacteriota bacterium]
MKAHDIEKIAVIGAGAAGHGIAQVLAVAGFKVALQDINQEIINRAIAGIGENLDFLEGKGKISAEEKNGVLKNRIKIINKLPEAVSGAELVIEAVPEKMDLKKQILREISDNAPKEAILATTTSAMSIAEISQSVTNPGRFIGMHFFNPVNRMKLVEVTGCEITEEKYISAACEFAKRCGKVPVRVLKDSPGFIVNRINAPAQALLSAVLDEGKIEPASVDLAVKNAGMPMGPFELADYVGLDVFMDTLEYYARTLSPDYTPGMVIRKKVAKNQLGMKTGKGIYFWRYGRAKIGDPAEDPELKMLHFLSIQANQAVKLYRKGIAGSTGEIDQAMIFGTRAIAGPFALAVNMQPDHITGCLEKLKERYGLDILTPAQEIKDGSFKDFS